MKKNLYLIIVTFVLISVLVAACGKMSDKMMNFEGGSSKTTDMEMKMDAPPPPPPPTSSTLDNVMIMEEKPSNAPGGNTGEENITAPTSETIENKKEVTEKVPSKIIKTADIKFQVKKYDESRKNILALVKQNDAYVQSENQTNYNTSIDNTIVIRVKSDGFDNLVEKLLAESIYVDSKKIVADDVTEQFVDVQARLKSKKEVELQYLDLLKKAKSIYEILQVQQYIRTIREEIDSFEGRLKYMSDRSEYSTINLSFYEKIPSTLAPSPENSFWYRIGNAFSGGWSVLLSIFIGIVALWPLWLIGVITLVVIMRLVKRKKK